MRLSNLVSSSGPRTPQPVAKPHGDQDGIAPRSATFTTTPCVMGAILVPIDRVGARHTLHLPPCDPPIRCIVLSMPSRIVAPSTIDNTRC